MQKTDNKLMWVDINSLQPNRYNPKITKEYSEKYEAIKAGIKEMGMLSPVDVREIDGEIPYEIIDGFHRWKGCKELGHTEIPISSWGKIDESQAKKITILKEKARIPLDLIKTAEILNELAKDTALEDLARQVGYSMPDLTDDLKLVNFDFSDYDKNKDKDLEGSGETVKTLSIIMNSTQYEVIMRGINRAKQEGETDSEARALELICADFLSGEKV